MELKNLMEYISVIPDYRQIWKHVENKLHWRLDVVMNENDCKTRRGNAAELFLGIRYMRLIY